jgi:deoxyadenosine/deoxycytidine kinase
MAHTNGPAPFVVIAGNIGVGKSTLVARLAQSWGWQAAHEPNDENPYLADFYSDMRAWGFHSQVFFLGKRLEQHNRICRDGLATLQDRSVYEDAEIFARNLHLQGHLAGRDWSTYYDLYRTMADIIRPPDLVVYLRASVDTLLTRVAQRNRVYEREIPPVYLAQINALYDDWAQQFTLAPLCVVEADELNWADGDDGLNVVAGLIASKVR